MSLKTIFLTFCFSSSLMGKDFSVPEISKQDQKKIYHEVVLQLFMLGTHQLEVWKWLNSFPALRGEGNPNTHECCKNTACKFSRTRRFFVNMLMGSLTTPLAHAFAVKTSELIWPEDSPKSALEDMPFYQSIKDKDSKKIAEDVLAQMGMALGHEISGACKKGPYERAIRTVLGNLLMYPFSMIPTFVKKNKFFV